MFSVPCEWVCSGAARATVHWGVQWAGDGRGHWPLVTSPWSTHPNPLLLGAGTPNSTPPPPVLGATDHRRVPNCAKTPNSFEGRVSSRGYRAPVARDRAKSGTGTSSDAVHHGAPHPSARPRPSRLRPGGQCHFVTHPLTNWHTGPMMCARLSHQPLIGCEVTPVAGVTGQPLPLLSPGRAARDG